MNLTSKTSRIKFLLRQHEVLNLEGQHRMAIECKNGVIWVTCAGEQKDHILHAGKRYVPKTNGTIVIEALDEALVHIAKNN